MAENRPQLSPEEGGDYCCDAAKKLIDSTIVFDGSCAQFHSRTRRRAGYFWDMEISIMPDDKSKRGKADRDRVSANEPYEIRRVAKSADVSTEKAREATKAAGPMRKNIMKKLGKKK